MLVFLILCTKYRTCNSTSSTERANGFLGALVEYHDIHNMHTCGEPENMHNANPHLAQHEAR